MLDGWQFEIQGSWRIRAFSDATVVDMAMLELREAGKPISVQAVKVIIQFSEECKTKLKREIFSYTNIARAIK